MLRTSIPRLARALLSPRLSPSSTSQELARPVLPQLAFVVGLGGASIGAAAYMTNQDTDERRNGVFGSLRRSTGLQVDMMRSRAGKEYERAKGFVQATGGSRLAIILAENWLELGEAKRTGAGLIASFAAVWLAWRLPASARFGQWLAHNPLSGKNVTLLTSVFSHRTLPHLAFNSIALYSFGTACFKFLDYSEILPRSTSRFEFLAFFATAGLASSFASHLWFSRVVAGRLLRVLPAAQVKASMLPSLGASGAVYGCVAMTALAFPETSVSLIFLPFFPIPIGAATASMVALDAVGLLRGWRMFDHAAHLAGAGFGGLWWWKGHEWFEQLRLSMGAGQARKRVQQ
ncbi:hypothetical protein JCM11641_000746 [Rhodosporidiobolus odoratus]